MACGHALDSPRVSMKMAWYIVRLVVVPCHECMSSVNTAQASEMDVIGTSPEGRRLDMEAD